ncbi:MAG: acyltransferase [Muribaculaceae bacterium]|nr:acyltransferase [Muribaculaceae bacterium]
MTEVLSRQDIVGRAISALRFPLIIGVILIHCNLLPSLGADGTGRGFDIWSYKVIGLLSGVMARSCVPLFFILAGYLYFRGIDYLTPRLWWSKTRRRAVSLVIPYLLWNLLGLCAFLFKRYLGESAGFGQYTDFSISPLTVLAGFWALPHTSYPYDFVLWFVRDLIVVAIFLAPVIWYMTLGRMWIFVISTVMMMVWGSGMMYIDGWYYFYVGAFIAITRIDISPLGRYAWLLTCIWLILSFLLLYSSDIEWWARGLGFLCQFSGVMAMTAVALHYVEQGGQLNVWLENSAFFVYACHGLYSSAVMRFLLGHINTDSNIGIITVYFTDFILLLGISLLLYTICLKCLPSVTSLLTGGRTKKSRQHIIKSSDGINKKD